MRAEQVISHCLTSFCKRLNPLFFYRHYQKHTQRVTAERLLGELSGWTQGQFRGVVLVDAMWDNPNYWIRYAIFRSALGLAAGREVGVLGQYRAALCRRTLQPFGVSDTVQILSLRGNQRAHRGEARRLLARTKTPDDILGWRLPHEFPPDFVYDGILKRQRLACVDLDDSRLLDYVAEALGSIAAAELLLDAYRFDLVLLSHAVNFQFAALAWLAAKRNIPVVLLYGNYGVARFAKITKPEDIYDTSDRPTRADLDALPSSKAEALARIGQAYLEKRRAGQTNDIGATYAFQNRQKPVDRKILLDRFRWDPRRPIVAVYAPNWFDFPHPCGMSNFRDFLDWLETTVRVAGENSAVNWLFRAHPCDDWYGGITLSDLMPACNKAHIRLAAKGWNGAALMHCVDALVTYHGTAGIEYAAMGKPVLLSDRGWYHDLGLAKWPQTRGEYLECLATDWWERLDSAEVARRAQIFAGWYFGRPAWQGGFVLDDDSVQDPIYATVPALFAENKDVIAKEIETIRSWFYSDSRHYHTYKMTQAEEFAS